MELSMGVGMGAMGACRRRRQWSVAGVLLSTFLLADVPSLAGQDAPPRVLTSGRLADEAPTPTLDGRVDEPVWMSVEPYTNFTQQDPNEGEPATERTEVRVLLDRRTLYIGIICFDRAPDRIVVSESRRDSDLNETDSIQVLLDTFDDNQNAFIFGTNPIGIEYDGQVAGEGQTGSFQNRGGVAGSQRGQLSGFNANWDGDWRVRAQITERGWETEMAIPLKTLRYNSGTDRSWGFNVMRNIRRKNEQVFLSPIERGYSLHRVSQAATLTGLDLPPRRDIKAIPYVAAKFNKDYIRPSGEQLDREGDVGLDVKWGVRPNLTADFTVNTDFAQVEADEEQVNLTRFELFFPEKRSFFLENASIFQFGAPQQIDLFFSRRIGLSQTGLPIDILGGGRLSGKAGQFNVGLLNMQTAKTCVPANECDSGEIGVTGVLVAPSNNFTVARIQREVGRSNFGAIFVNRQGTGDAAGSDNYNRAYGVDTALQLSSNGKLFAFFARSDSPGSRGGAGYAGRIIYGFANPLFNWNVGYSQVSEGFNAEVGFVPRRGYRRPEARAFLTYQPKKYPWIRRFSPHINGSAYYDEDGNVQTSQAHVHFFEIQPSAGGRFGYRWDYAQDRPLVPFRVYTAADGKSVVIPPGLYSWGQWTGEYLGDPSRALYFNFFHTFGDFYDGDYWKIDTLVGARLGSRLITETGYTHEDIKLPTGAFTTTLVPVKVSYSFTTLASLSALVQYNSQVRIVSSNIRLALLNRSGTGLFVVYNDRRDTTTFTPADVLGRSLVLKYTRLFDF
jgi:hypothetical protein